MVAERNLVEGIGPIVDPNDADTYPMSLGGLGAVGGTRSTFRQNVVRNAGVGIGPFLAREVVGRDNVIQNVHTAVALWRTATAPQPGRILDLQRNDFTGYLVSAASVASVGQAAWPIPLRGLACNWWGDAAGPAKRAGCQRRRLHSVRHVAHRGNWKALLGCSPLGRRSPLCWRAHGVVEATAVMCSKRGPSAVVAFDALLPELDVEIVPTSQNAADAPQTNGRAT